MPTNLPNRYQVNLGANTSLETGDPWYVGDFARLTISVITGAAAASRSTILGSNMDGLTSSLSVANRLVSNNTWSIITTIVAPGTYTIDAGFRWVNSVRDTSNSGQTASNITHIFTGAY